VGVNNEGSRDDAEGRIMIEYREFYSALQRCNSGEVADLALLGLSHIAKGGVARRAVRHPLGFTCMPVGRNETFGVCIHVWNRGWAPQLATSAVHSHSWDLASYVLHGQLGNQRFDVFDEADDPQYRVFEVGISEGLDDLRATRRLVRSEQQSPVWHVAGEAYGLPAGAFHASLPPPRGEMTVTLLAGRQAPRFADLCLGGVGTPSHRAYRRLCSPAETARLARDLMSLLHQLGGQT
jgi:hypothetical protein